MASGAKLIWRPQLDRVHFLLRFLRPPAADPGAEPSCGRSHRAEILLAIVAQTKGLVFIRRNGAFV